MLPRLIRPHSPLLLSCGSAAACSSTGVSTSPMTSRSAAERAAICFTYWLISLEQKVEGEKIMRQLTAETQNPARLGCAKVKSSPFPLCLLLCYSHPHNSPYLWMSPKAPSLASSPGLSETCCSLTWRNQPWILHRDVLLLIRDNTAFSIMA